MLECCILFSHYADNPPTRRHLQLVTKNNPYPVILVHRNPAQPIPGSLNIGIDPYFASEHTDPGTLWSSCDNILYQWYRHGGVRAKRYIYLEWDCVANTPVREHFDSVWDADFVASVVLDQQEWANWRWFREQQHLLPSKYRSYALGVNPLNGIFLSDRALRTIANTPDIPLHIFCELRLGTLLNYHGFKHQELPLESSSNNVYFGGKTVADSSGPGIFHPVKEY